MAHCLIVSDRLPSCYLEQSPPAPWSHGMYIDPTTGSLVLQILAAGVLSFMAMATRVREVVKNFFRALVPRRWSGKP
jgi:hypothetical protein